MVTKAEGAGEQTTDFSVDAFHFSTAQPGFVVAQYALSMAKQGSRHGLELPDAAGFCLGAPFAQERQALRPSLCSQSSASSSLSPKLGRAWRAASTLCVPTGPQFAQNGR
jgi:hypothetical protein